MIRTYYAVFNQLTKEYLHGAGRRVFGRPFPSKSGVRDSYEKAISYRKMLIGKFDLRIRTAGDGDLGRRMKEGLEREKQDAEKNFIIIKIEISEYEPKIENANLDDINNEFVYHIGNQ